MKHSPRKYLLTLYRCSEVIFHHLPKIIFFAILLEDSMQMAKNVILPILYSTRKLLSFRITNISFLGNRPCFHVEKTIYFKIQIVCCAGYTPGVQTDTAARSRSAPSTNPCRHRSKFENLTMTSWYVGKRSCHCAERPLVAVWTNRLIPTVINKK